LLKFMMPPSRSLLFIPQESSLSIPYELLPVTKVTWQEGCRKPKALMIGMRRTGVQRDSDASAVALKPAALRLNLKVRTPDDTAKALH
jgi:hypothetical protein